MYVMPSRLTGRRREVATLLPDIAAWAEGRPDVRGVVLVGSYARGSERMASDVDLVILCTAPDDLTDAKWFTSLRPGARLIREKDWGPVRERRFRLRSGLIVELGIAPLDWAAVPVDPGTRRVLGDGHTILYDTILDGTGLLRRASDAVGAAAGM
jgi:predicted nucleotidyltransferase